MHVASGEPRPRHRAGSPNPPFAPAEDTLSALAAFSRADVSQAAAIVERYADVRIGIADASIVVLAGRYRTTRLLTLDERHFRVVAPLHADAFTILPAGRS